MSNSSQFGYRNRADRLHRQDLPASIDWMDLARVVLRRPHAFFLDSATATTPARERRSTAGSGSSTREQARPGRGGGFSFLGCAPDSMLVARGGVVEVTDADGNVQREVRADPFVSLRRWLGPVVRWKGQPSLEADGLPPFVGGAVGCFGYDARVHLEDLPQRHGGAGSAPELAFGIYRRVFVLDHASGKIVAYGCLDEQEDARFFSDHVEDMVAAARSAPVAAAQSRTDDVIARERLTSNFTRDEFVRAVARAKSYILAGDVFQVNLSQRFRAPFHGSLPRLYERLRTTSPAPFAGFYAMPDGSAVLSTSPERFLEVSGRRVETRPIKGTRPRADDPQRDRELARELCESGKDRAELAMIVDLERNDLGRVCEYGSVIVREDRVLESHADVHHLVATVEGMLRDDVDLIDAVRATFPGGSITGAPKIRAMEIIDELERDSRGPYTGSLGYLGFDGHMDLNILIRTLYAANGEISFHVGGGIVADSDPESEYDETLHKARGMLRTLLQRDGIAAADMADSDGPIPAHQ